MISARPQLERVRSDDELERADVRVRRSRKMREGDQAVRLGDGVARGDQRIVLAVEMHDERVARRWIGAHATPATSRSAAAISAARA